MKPRALFGDDDESLRKAFNRFLSMKGFDVDEASTPNELIESTRNAYTNNRYGVIITDLNYEDYVKNGAVSYYPNIEAIEEYSYRTMARKFAKVFNSVVKRK